MIFQIAPESKRDDSGNCFIDFYIIENGITVVNQKGENKERKTYAPNNQLHGSHKSQWQGWVRLGASPLAKVESS